MITSNFKFSVSGLKQIMVLVTLCLLSSGFIACSDDEKEEPEVPAEAKSFTVHATSTNPDDWCYFSFEKGDSVVIDKANAAKDQTWDIAFQRFYVRTNSGTSGNGQGGALDTKQTTFDAVTTVPTSGFIADSKEKMMLIMSKFEEHSLNTAFQVPGYEEYYSWTWYNYMINTWFPNNNVFIIRTADGKHYAKLIFKQYKDDKGDSGHPTFEYVYPFK